MIVSSFEVRALKAIKKVQAQQEKLIFPFLPIGLLLHSPSSPCNLEPTGGILFSSYCISSQPTCLRGSYAIAELITGDLSACYGFIKSENYDIKVFKWLNFHRWKAWFYRARLTNSRTFVSAFLLIFAVETPTPPPHANKISSFISPPHTQWKWDF